MKVERTFEYQCATDYILAVEAESCSRGCTRATCPEPEYPSMGCPVVTPIFDADNGVVDIEAWEEVRPGRIRCRLFLDEPRVLPGQEALLEVPDEA